MVWVNYKVEVDYRRWGKVTRKWKMVFYKGNLFKGFCLIYKDDMLNPPDFKPKLFTYYTFKSEDLDPKGPRKEDNMNEQVQTAQVDPVIVDEDVPEFLKRAAEKLEQDGEVLIQTAEDVGTETPATVH